MMSTSQNYREYHLSFGEQLKCAVMALGMAVIVAYLFYDSIWGMAVMPLVYYIFHRNMIRQGVERIQESIAKEFLDILRSLSTALLAGLSMENAWREAEKELCMMYGQQSVLGRELASINRSVMLNIPLEQLLDDLGERSGNTEIASFAEVFAFAKRSGGNFIAIIEGTADHIRMEYETEHEIQVLIAAKKLEQKIMNAVPILILAYLKVTSIGFLDILYGNVGGVLFMSGCLAAYAGSLLLAERILKIKM